MSRMSRMAFAKDPTTGEDFSLSVADDFGGAETAALTLRVFHELALCYGVTFWEQLQMLRLQTLGPACLEPDYDPERELQELKELCALATEDERGLSGKHSLQFAIECWERSLRGLSLFAKLHPDPLKRAKFAAEVAEGQRRMDAILDRAVRRRARG